MTASKLNKLRRIEDEASALQVQQDFGLAVLLAQISRGKLYEARGFKSFGAYLDASSLVYRISRRQAYRLVRGAHILTYLRNHSLPPTSEKQVLDLIWSILH